MGLQNSKKTIHTSELVLHDPEAAQLENMDHNTNIRGLTRVLKTEEKRRKEQTLGSYSCHRENMQLLKHLFKKMDPSIMGTGSYIRRGQLQLSFKYDAKRELLLVKVIKAQDLNAKDLRGKVADPFVKLYLHPAEQPRLVHCTKTAQYTLDPVYHEIFAFPMQSCQIKESLLIAQVLDHDLMEKDDLIGEVIMPLSDIDWNLSPIHTDWYELKAPTDLMIKGDIDVSLHYRRPGNLMVTLHRANNLTNRYEQGAPNPFVKVQVPGIAVVNQTKTCENTVNPVWEETLEFPLPQEELSERHIVLHAIDYDDADKNDSLGQIVIELANLDLHEGYHGNFKLADLKNTRHLRERHFQSSTVQELRESLVAHAASRNPKWLFCQHSGSKVVTLKSPKAGTQARLRLVDGIPVF